MALLFSSSNRDDTAVYVRQNLNLLSNNTPEAKERRRLVERALYDALENDSIRIHYQPICDSKTGKIRSAEALVRLCDPNLGTVFPDEFIPIAEETGDIIWLGEYVFENACKFLSAGNALAHGLEYMEVNLSTIQCLDLDLANKFTAIADKYNISPSSITLEITETTEAYSEVGMRQVMTDLLAAGFSFALDDFGTGYANYSYIVNYPFKLIKIDKSFLWSINDKPENKIVFEAMLQLIDNLGKKTVVEGVETEEQQRLLTNKGVDYLQGYYYSKPIPENQFISYIKHHNAAAG